MGDSVAVSLMALVAALWHSVIAVLELVYEQRHLVFSTLLGNYWGLGAKSLENVVEMPAYMDIHSAVVSGYNHRRMDPTDFFAG